VYDDVALSCSDTAVECTGAGTASCAAAAAADEASLGVPAVHHHSPPVTQEAANTFFEEWCTEAGISSRILARAAAVGHWSVGGPAPKGPWELSLVSQSSPIAETVFVQWTDPVNRLGRPVKVVEVNGEWEAVWPVPARVPVKSFHEAIVVHPAIGVTMRRSRVVRAVVPLLMVRLRRMFETANGNAESLCPCCRLCGAHSDEETIMQCALCLIEAHQACSARVAEIKHDDQNWPAQADLPKPSSWIPRGFRGSVQIKVDGSIMSRPCLCNLCARWLGKLEVLRTSSVQ
jgi:hypothetical protein